MAFAARRFEGFSFGLFATRRRLRLIFQTGGMGRVAFVLLVLGVLWAGSAIGYTPFLGEEDLSLVDGIGALQPVLFAGGGEAFFPPVLPSVLALSLKQNVGGITVSRGIALRGDNAAARAVLAIHRLVMKRDTTAGSPNGLKFSNADLMDSAGRPEVLEPLALSFQQGPVSTGNERYYNVPSGDDFHAVTPGAEVRDVAGALEAGTVQGVLLDGVAGGVRSGIVSGVGWNMTTTAAPGAGNYPRGNLSGSGDGIFSGNGGRVRNSASILSKTKRHVSRSVVSGPAPQKVIRSDGGNSFALMTPNATALQQVSLTPNVGGNLSGGILTTAMTSPVPSVAVQSAAAPLAPAASPGDTRFAVLGDYGNGVAEVAVANRLKTFGPGFIISVGDEIYTTTNGGTTAEFDTAVGNVYGSFIKGTASPTVQTAATNNFYPVIGNHDVIGSKTAGTTTAYENYFDLTHASDPAISTSSGNERYYDVVRGNLHFFMLSTDTRDIISGQAVGSAQRTWFEGPSGNAGVLAASSSIWNIVVSHHPPFASTDTPASGDGNNTYLQWGFSSGANKVPLIYSGHTHNYDRMTFNGQQYVIDGAGGRPLDPFLASPGPFIGPAPALTTAFRSDTNNGFSIVDSNATYLTSKHFEQNGKLIDKFTLLAPGAPTLQAVSFKQNTGGYTGAHDIELREDGVATSATATTVTVSNDDNVSAGNQRTQTLLRFDNIFGAGVSQVPLGVKITSAVLKMNVTDAGSGFEIHRMLSSWSDTSATWSGFVGGVQTDDVEAVSAFDETVGLGDANAIATTNVGAGVFTLDVSQTVQSWVDGAANNGWLFTSLTGGVNTISFSSVDGASAPQLDIEFITVPEPATPTMLGIAAAGLLRRRRRHVAA